MKFANRIVSKVIHTFFVLLSKILKQRGRVYMLHSVGDGSHEFNVSVFSFERLLQHLQGKNVIRLEEWEKGKDFICLTFDDVADSFYYNAYPLLKKYNIPFTIFVSCSLLDTDNFITTEMLKEIADCELCTIGSHGWKHSFYTNFNKEDAAEDLLSSKQKIEEITHRPVEIYAFPFGSIYACGLRKKSLVESFYKYGFGTISSPLTMPNFLPSYFLPRIKVDDTFISNLK